MTESNVALALYVCMPSRVSHGVERTYGVGVSHRIVSHSCFCLRYFSIRYFCHLAVMASCHIISQYTIVYGQKTAAQSPHRPRCPPPSLRPPLLHPWTSTKNTPPPIIPRLLKYPRGPRSKMKKYPRVIFGGSTVLVL